MKRARLPLWVAYNFQRLRAAERGIAFELGFLEWLKVWGASGHLASRGRKGDQYCMARYGDRGPYAVGNVKIILGVDNVREAKVGKTLSLAHREKISMVLSGRPGRPHSSETKEKLRVANVGKTLSAATREKIGRASKGHPVSAEVRARISAARKGKPLSIEHKAKLRARRLAWWGRRRQEVRYVW